MKALDEYLLIVVFMLLLKRVLFANLMFDLNRETWQWKGYLTHTHTHTYQDFNVVIIISEHFSVVLLSRFIIKF